MALRRYTLMIDCPEERFPEAVAFWSAALQSTVEHSGDYTADPYVALPDSAGELRLEVQRVGAAGRYHLDLSATDVEAEVHRLEQLGAQRVEKHDSWWVMRAPTGQLFCVVPEVAAPEEG